MSKGARAQATYVTLLVGFVIGLTESALAAQKRKNKISRADASARRSSFPRSLSPVL